MIFVFNSLFRNFYREEKTAARPKDSRCGRALIAADTLTLSAHSLRIVRKIQPYSLTTTNAVRLAAPFPAQHLGAKNIQFLYSIIIYVILSLRRRMRQSAALQEADGYGDP